eukprot:g5104.t1
MAGLAPLKWAPAPPRREPRRGSCRQRAGPAPTTAVAVTLPLRAPRKAKGAKGSGERGYENGRGRAPPASNRALSSIAIFNGALEDAQEHFQPVPGGLTSPPAPLPKSFQFLVDVAEFRQVVAAAHSTDAGESSKEDFNRCTLIVNEYIKDASHSEINIDGATKRRILGFYERSAYASLDVDGRKNIFSAAEKEITKMLADNLLEKFKATAECKEIAGDMIFEVPEGMCRSPARQMQRH